MMVRRSAVRTARGLRKPARNSSRAAATAISEEIRVLSSKDSVSSWKSGVGVSFKVTCDADAYVGPALSRSARAVSATLAS